jgi:hypothetical protein
MVYSLAQTHNRYMPWKTSLKALEEGEKNRNLFIYVLKKTRIDTF